MKRLTNYIQEGLLSRKISTKTPIRYTPKDPDDLVKIIVDLLNKGQTNLNCIDVSNITEMDWVFYEINYKVKVKDIDISEWNVSKVEDMRGMFGGCKEFNSDLYNWDVSNVKNISDMFCSCHKFNSDISKWNVANVGDMYGTFYNCSNFNYDLSGWLFKETPLLNTDTFRGCDTLEKNNKIPNWYDFQYEGHKELSK